MSQWELQSRCRQWHTIAIADGLDPCYLLNLRLPACLGSVVSEVQVMHDGQVNAGQSEPLEAVLVGAQNAVMGVVELDLEWPSAVPRAPIEGSQVGWRPQDAANFGRDDK